MEREKFLRLHSRGVWQLPFVWNGILSNTYLLRIFQAKASILKEKKLLEVEQLVVEDEELMECSPSGMIIEPLQELWNVLSHIE